MYILMALKLEEVLTDRVYYCMHQLVVGSKATADIKDPFGPINN